MHVSIAPLIIRRTSQIEMGWRWSRESTGNCLKKGVKISKKLFVCFREYCFSRDILFEHFGFKRCTSILRSKCITLKCTKRVSTSLSATSYPFSNQDDESYSACFRCRGFGCPKSANNHLKLARESGFQPTSKSLCLWPLPFLRWVKHQTHRWFDFQPNLSPNFFLMDSGECRWKDKSCM